MFIICDVELCTVRAILSSVIKFLHTMEHPMCQVDSAVIQTLRQRRRLCHCLVQSVFKLRVSEQSADVICTALFQFSFFSELVESFWDEPWLIFKWKTLTVAYSAHWVYSHPQLLKYQWFVMAPIMSNPDAQDTLWLLTVQHKGLTYLQCKAIFNSLRQRQQSTFQSEKEPNTV